MDGFGCLKIGGLALLWADWFAAALTVVTCVGDDLSAAPCTFELFAPDAAAAVVCPVGILAPVLAAAGAPIAAFGGLPLPALFRFVGIGVPVFIPCVLLPCGVAVAAPAAEVCGGICDWAPADAPVPAATAP